MNLRHRIDRLEESRQRGTRRPLGVVLVVGDPGHLSEAEALELARAEGQGGAIVILPDNGRGDR